MERLAEVLSTIFKKVSDFFDIFDLSFFLSGAVCLSAVGAWMHRAGNTGLLDIASGTALGVIVLAIACYVTGLVCFAFGRWARYGIRDWIHYVQTLLGPTRSADDAPRWFTAAQPFDSFFTRAVRGHGLEADPVFQQYLNRPPNDRGLSRLYVRLWAKIRETPALNASFTLVKRYWIMAAAYDGIGFALAVWMAVIFAWNNHVWIRSDDNWNPLYSLPILFLLFFAMIACFRESGRLVQFQVEELLATLSLLGPETRAIWVSPQPSTPAVTAPAPAQGQAPALAANLPAPAQSPPAPQPDVAIAEAVAQLEKALSLLKPKPPA